jgi:hypothetical protein
VNNVPFHAMESLLSTSLNQIDTAGIRVKSSLEELIGSAIDLASAEDAAQSAMVCVPDLPDDEEDGCQDVNHDSLCETARYDVAAAVERALNELTLQERVLGDARSTLEQIKESLALGNTALSVSMQICPKPGCACSSPQTEK